MMEEDPEDRVDPMARIFPRVTKCTFNKFGPSGSLMRRDAMCVLPVNIVNEVSHEHVARGTWHVKMFELTYMLAENIRVSLVLDDSTCGHQW